MLQFKTYNDLVNAMSERAKELGDMKMPELKLAAGFDCDTPHDAKQKAKGRSRGDLILEILQEEFFEEFDREWQE